MGLVLDGCKANRQGQDKAQHNCGVKGGHRELTGKENSIRMIPGRSRFQGRPWGRRENGRYRWVERWKERHFACPLQPAINILQCGQLS